MNDSIRKTMQNGETELNISDVFWSALGKWRKILLWGLILAVLLGGRTLWNSLSRISDADYVRAATEKYEKSLQIYDLNYASYQEQIDRYTLEIMEREAYAKHAAILRLDPYQVYVCKGLYYIDAVSGDADAEPQTNYTQALLTAYGALLSELDVRAVLREADALVFPEEYDNYEGFLSVVMDMEGGTLSYTIYGADETQVRVLAQAAQATVDENAARLRAEVAPHVITLLHETVSVGSDPELTTLHTNYNNDLSTLAGYVVWSVDKRDGLVKPSAEDFSRRTALKSAIKWGILGFAVGAFLCVAFCAFRFVSREILADPEDLKARYGARVLGVIPADRERKGLFAGLDRRIAGHYGVPAGMNRGDGLRLAVTELKAALGARKSLLLTGTGETATLETLRGELLKQCPELEIRTAGNVCLDADALESLLNCKTVLLAETLQTSRHGAIRRELLRVLESGKDCLGFILLEK